MEPSTEALWRRYRDHGDADARADLLRQYLGLVYSCAGDMMARVGSAVEFDDLVSAGSLGLVKAVDSFDLSRGLAFSTYAVQRIRGAMLDDLRAADWRPRSVRARGRQITATVARIEARAGRAAEHHEVAAELEIDMDAYWRWRERADNRSMISLDQTRTDDEPAGATIVETLSDPEPRVDEVMTADERLGELRAAITTLPEKERTVLALYFFEDLTLRQIGEVLHVTESRVSQIRTRALARLREALPTA